MREAAREAAVFEDALPPVLERRPIALRGFDGAGMLMDAALAMPGDVARQKGVLFEREEIAYIHAHNAAYGCFAAAVQRA